MKKILIGLLASLSMSSHAASILNEKTIYKTHVHINQGFFFRTSENMENPDGCENFSWYHIAPSSTFAKEAFSLVLAAQMSKKKVQFYLNGCAGPYPVVEWINTYN